MSGTWSNPKFSKERENVGEQHGREQGEKIGREQGEKIGRIQTLQEMLGLPVASSEELHKRTLEELTHLVEQLRKQLHPKTNGSNGTNEAK